jgi:hypothetical protein
MTKWPDPQGQPPICTTAYDFVQDVTWIIGRCRAATALKRKIINAKKIGILMLVAG